ncbi:MAG: lipase maturation factor family protein [Kofleriaceae bacterium]
MTATPAPSDELAGPQDVPNVRSPSPLARITAWLGPPRNYQLTRWLILRLLGFVYLFAFLGIAIQGPPLLGDHGLTPIATYLDRPGVQFWDAPSVLFWNSSDAAIRAWAYAGILLSIAALVGYANTVSLLALWFIYGSFVRVGQMWFSFGWEIQILETTLIAALLAHPWDPRPMAPCSPPFVAIVLMRWLAFRIMLGAGLIKLRGDACWTELTCLDWHFETQPIPNPLSAWFHHLPHGVHAAGVLGNHVAELVLPWLVFGPRIARLIAGIGMLVFQVVLIASGNLAFLNWLTIIPILACFDDDFLVRLVPRRWRQRLHLRMSPPPRRDAQQLLIGFAIAFLVILLWDPVFGSLSARTEVVIGCALIASFAVIVRWQRHRVAASGVLDGHQLAAGCFAALVAIASVPVIANLASSNQAMNRPYDRLALVNTYGAFGSVGDVRHELIIEGTLDADPQTVSWRAYELPCKPGDLERQPCILGPYHRRLDWLIWFAAMNDEPRTPWVFHLVWKLLEGDRSIRELLAIDPFDGERPVWVRIRRFVYHLEPPGSLTRWRRDHEQPWLGPLSLNAPGFREALERRGWPSPSLR